MAAETVGDPRAERRVARENIAGLHFIDRRFVVRMHVVHRANHCEFIRLSRDVWKQFGDFEPALTVLGEFPLTAQQFRGADLERAFGDRVRHVFAVMLFEHWLGIKRVDLARPALHAQMNDGLGARRKMRPLWMQVHRSTTASSCWAVRDFGAHQLRT